MQRGDLDALANRIAALESTVKSLSDNAAHPASAADDQAARLAIAAAALRAAVERGAPYQAELAAVQSFGADANVARAAAIVRRNRRAERGDAGARFRNADTGAAARVRHGGRSQ